jgi:uncharacterized protein YecE (DUF72 family)
MGDIFIGTSGFSFDDWIGEIYLGNIRKQEMLPCYEIVLAFNTVEVNYTYYALPSKKTMESFVRRTSDSFFFAVKVYRGITHERSEATKNQFKMFKEGIHPLGKSLKALLFQFPFPFLPTLENIDYLRASRMNFRIMSRWWSSETPVGLRMATWMS